MIREFDLFQTLTATDRLSDLLPVLHQHAIAAVGGRNSLVVQFNRSGDALLATSGFGIDQIPSEPWPARLIPDTFFRQARPNLWHPGQAGIPFAGAPLGTDIVVAVPLVQMQEPAGVLMIGGDRAPRSEQLEHAASVGHAFVIALERARNESERDLQHQLRELLEAFSRRASSATLASGLETLCMSATRLFGADRTSVWLHDRRARMMTLAASSDVPYASEERRVPTSDALEPASVALWRDRAEIAETTSPEEGTLTARLTLPLKGQRRALGTLVMDGVRLTPGSQAELLERADAMGRQMSGAIENVLLLETVLRSRRELENTFDSLADLVAVSDQSGRLVYTNAPFAVRAGGAQIDRPMTEVVGPAIRALIEDLLRDAAVRQIVNREVEDAVLGGTFFVTLTPLRGDDGDPMGLVLVARDVTPHAQLEAERAELRNKLMQSEKLAALGQFVAGIAHELNNPLQGVLGHLELLRTTGAFPKTLRRDMQRIYREADRAAKIVRNLLVFAGSRRLVRRRTSLNATLSRVLALRAPAHRAAGIEVIRRHEDSLPRVAADPLLLHQAFLNVVLNAEQAIGGPGRIETQTSVLSEQGRHYVVVRIRDTGPGIPPESMPRLFEPFYTTKEVGKGTGLGLAITYGIIQDHNGQITAANHPEGGAVFTVQLPVEIG